MKEIYFHSLEGLGSFVDSFLLEKIKLKSAPSLPTWKAIIWGVGHDNCPKSR